MFLIVEALMDQVEAALETETTPNNIPEAAEGLALTAVVAAPLVGMAARGVEP